jgi:hypothetical protein
MLIPRSGISRDFGGRMRIPAWSSCTPQPYMMYKEGTDKINGSRFARRIFPVAARGVAIAARDVAIVARCIASDVARGPARGVAIVASDVAIVAREIVGGGARDPARGVDIAARDVSTEVRGSGVWPRV